MKYLLNCAWVKANKLFAVRFKHLSAMRAVVLMAALASASAFSVSPVSSY